MFEELNAMFESDTIKPTFERVHIILAMLKFASYPKGLGRYKLKEELLIGSGTARSLIEKLKDKINFLIPASHIRKGHVLTEEGKDFLNKLKSKIPVLIEGNTEILKDMIIESESDNAGVYLCQVKGAIKRLTNGIEQRDAAIKIGGVGATCIYFDGEKLNYALGFASETDKSKMRIAEDVQTYFNHEIKKYGAQLEKDDVIIIGLGNILIENEKLLKTLSEEKKSADLHELASMNSRRRAQLAALNAALTLLPN